MELRPYQARAVEEVIAKIAERPILVAPCRSGKSVMGAEIVQRLGRRTLWLAHRRELISQAADHLERLGLSVGIVLADTAPTPEAQVQVASVQTLTRREAPQADLVVTDEVHHVVADTYQRLLALYPSAHRLGLTATPFRLDGLGLGSAFGKIVVASTVRELVDDGTLVAPTVYCCDDPDLKSVRKVAGEFNLAQAGEVMDRPQLAGRIVATWLARAKGRKTICFATTIAHSEHIAAEFVRAGVPAVHLDGATPKEKREEALQRLAAGELQVISNVGLFGEGVDVPELEVAIIARPTASLQWHIQACSRVMTSAPAKVGAWIFDHAGNHLRHGMVTQPLDYSLEDRVRQENKGAPLDGTIICRACGFIAQAVDIGRDGLCPECGAQLRSPMLLPEETDEELVRLVDDWPTRQRMWGQYLASARHWGRKLGWAQHKYRSRFGAWPLLVGDRLVDETNASHADQRAVYDQLSAVVLSRGFSPGWAAYRYKALFGAWPPWAWTQGLKARVAVTGSYWAAKAARGVAS